LAGLITQQSLKNNQYPKSITEANNVLSNHKFDQVKSHKSQTNMNKNLQENSKKDKDSEKINLSFAQVEGKCYCCRKTGHLSPECCFKDKPKEKWFINKTQQLHVQMNKKEKLNKTSKSSNINQNTKDESKSKEHQEGWAGVHFQLYQPTKCKTGFCLTMNLP
jgi:hypothetical protein